MQPRVELCGSSPQLYGLQRYWGILVSAAGSASWKVTPSVCVEATEGSQFAKWDVGPYLAFRLAARVGGSFEFGSQVLISSHPSRCVIPSGMVEGGERKRTADSGLGDAKTVG
jgi:hypothetical protein